MARILKVKIDGRRICGFAALSMCASILVISIFGRNTVSAGQDAPKQEVQAHPEFPAGEGRDTVLRLCVRCHSPNIILASGRDRLGWENTITKMVRLGATGEDEDFAEIADYLTKNFPSSPIVKIFVNMATDKQIAAVLGISVDDAKSIIVYRDKVKGFKSIEEMKQVPNVDAKKIDDKKENLVF